MSCSCRKFNCYRVYVTRGYDGFSEVLRSEASWAMIGARFSFMLEFYPLDSLSDGRCVRLLQTRASGRQSGRRDRYMYNIYIYIYPKPIPEMLFHGSQLWGLEPKQRMHVLRQASSFLGFGFRVLGLKLWVLGLLPLQQQGGTQQPRACNVVQDASLDVESPLRILGLLAG